MYKKVILTFRSALPQANAKVWEQKLGPHALRGKLTLCCRLWSPSLEVSEEEGSENMIPTVLERFPGKIKFICKICQI